MATKQSAGKTASKNIPHVLEEPTMAPRPARKVAAGTIEGPKGRKLAESVASPAEITEEQRQGERRQAENTAIAQFANGNMTTPAAHAPALTSEQQKKAEFDAKVAALAKEMGVEPPAVATRTARPARQATNGITRPASGTETGKVWEAADNISVAQNGHPASIAQLKEHHTMKGMNEHTLKTQYARWRRYNGVKGRLPTIKPVQAEGTYEGVPVLK